MVEIAPDRPQHGGRSLEELFARVDKAEDSEDAFLQLILEGAARRDPELPDLLRAGAIPRTLDAAIVGVLRGSPDDVDANRRLLEMVSGYRFVLPRPNGGLVYHDNTRDALLIDWKSTDQKRARFIELNQALASFHEGKYEESLESDRRLDEVSTLIAGANAERLRRLTEIIEAKMAASLLEALYHHLLADPKNGFEFFKTSFFALEDRSRIICQSLISFVRDFLQRLPPNESEPTLLAWLDYFDARVTRSSPDYDNARVEAVLRRLLDSEELPPDLRAWALGDLALEYEAQLKMDRAARTWLELTEQETGVDIYNDPVRNSSLGNLHWWLGDYPAAVRQLQLAIEKADEVPGARQDIGVLGRLDLSGVYSDMADWTAAFEVGIEALYRARTTFPNDRAMHAQVATRFARLLSTFDLRASDCAIGEAIALADARSDQRLYALMFRFEVLLQTGRVRTAQSWSDWVHADELHHHRESSVRLDLAYRRAMLFEREGRETEANIAYTALMDEAAGVLGVLSLWISALASRGSNRATLGDTRGAVADLTAAREEWSRCGCGIDAAGTDILLAEALSKAGDVAEARSLLDAAEATLPPGISPNRRTLLVIRGDLSERLGDWPAAQDYYEQALSIDTARRQLQGQASLLRKLAAVHAERSQWPLSAEYNRRAGVASGQLAEADAYNATREEQEAETRNAEGMRSFCDMEDRATALDRARQLFGSATELDPHNLWPLLNLSFTYAEQRDWLGATEALERVLDLSPAPMRTARLYGCLRDYVLEYARWLGRRGTARRAADVVATALDRLSGGLPPAELARVLTLHCVLLARAGEAAAAQEAYRAALSLAKGEHPLVESMATLVDAVDAYWAVDAVLQEVQEDPSASSAQDAAAATRSELGFRLDEVLGLTPDPSALETPVVTPILVEVGDGLVPIVDSRQDEGVFLHELLPAMKERILAGTGVEVPGVRMRSNPSLPPAGYRVQVDEVPVLTGSVVLGASFAVVPAEEGALEPGRELTDVHPLTGESGLWALVGVSDDRVDGANSLTTAQYLVHRIELVLRAHLVRYLGPEEVSMQVDTWSERDDGDLVASVLPDADARLRLTWVLQALVDDGMPIMDWRALLTAIREAGGITAPSRSLRHVVRARLRDRLPGLRTGRRPIPVPAEHEAALLDHPPGSPAAVLRSEPRHEFLRWLRQTVAVSGPAITLVTRTQDARELVSALARTEDRLITTLSEDEVTPA